jgi:hypothetical protein
MTPERLSAIRRLATQMKMENHGLLSVADAMMELLIEVERLKPFEGLCRTVPWTIEEEND